MERQREIASATKWVGLHFIISLRPKGRFHSEHQIKKTNKQEKQIYGSMKYAKLSAMQ